ncbi:MAG: DNA cytosine methyltransferase, partial [Desulfobacterales bacterium]|nr:DNA cytosine methyltransferase [Desulfobacterales bacterium]
MTVTDGTQKPGFYDFFAGGGMAHLGLGKGWRCLMANDFSPGKARAFRENFPPGHALIEADVWDLTTRDLPGSADLAWASFPCQDLSLAGKGCGLKGERSGSFWGFWKLMEELEEEGRQPPIVVLENVVGTISANKGADFRALLEALDLAGYRVGPMVINAMHFIPQSRPRLFIIALKKDHPLPKEFVQPEPSDLWHPAALRRAYPLQKKRVRESWVWWTLPAPPACGYTFTDLIEDHPTGVKWHSPEETQRLLDLMAPLHSAKVNKARASGEKIAGGVYRRMRKDKNGARAQRAEVRFDGYSGCLRTGSGGSSRQFIIVVEGDRIRTRLLSTREAARLMGVPDSYKLPKKYNEAYHLMGDGLVVPVVSWLEKHILTPLTMVKIE